MLIIIYNRKSNSISFTVPRGVLFLPLWPPLTVSTTLVATPSSNRRLETSSPRTQVLRINLNIDSVSISSHTCTRLSPPPSLSLSLSLQRPQYVCIPLISHFILYNKQHYEEKSEQNQTAQVWHHLVDSGIICETKTYKVVPWWITKKQTGRSQSYTDSECI